MAIATKAHCKTCRCFVKLKRHVCHRCGTRKLEKFTRPTGRKGPFGKMLWRCIDEQRCQENANYG